MTNFGIFGNFFLNFIIYSNKAKKLNFFQFNKSKKNRTVFFLMYHKFKFLKTWDQMKAVHSSIVVSPSFPYHWFFFGQILKFWKNIFSSTNSTNIACFGWKISLFFLIYSQKSQFIFNFSKFSK